MAIIALAKVKREAGFTVDGWWLSGFIPGVAGRGVVWQGGWQGVGEQCGRGRLTGYRVSALFRQSAT